MVEMKSVESTMIAAVGHDNEANELHVIFKDSRKYIYSSVGKNIFDALMSADSKGKFFNANIKKPKYNYRKA